MKSVPPDLVKTGEPTERSIFFFELVGDTVWGATAAMLRHLLGMWGQSQQHGFYTAAQLRFRNLIQKGLAPADDLGGLLTGNLAHRAGGQHQHFCIGAVVLVQRA